MNSVKTRNEYTCPYDNVSVCKYKDYDHCRCCDIYNANYPFEFDEDKEDPVNHPSHYTNGKFECIDVIIDILTWHKDPVYAWFTGQVIKYLWRWPHKNGLEDLKKAQFYLNRLIAYIEEEMEGK